MALSRQVARSVDALAKDARSRRARLASLEDERHELVAVVLAGAFGVASVVALVMVLASCGGPCR